MTRLAVPVPVYSNGKLLERQELWSLGLWTVATTTTLGSPRERVSWGLLYADTPTHMCYEATPGMPHGANQAIVVSGQTGWWTFDVGRDIRVKVIDLIAAFIELRNRSELIAEALRHLASTP